MHFSQATDLKEKWHFLSHVFCFPPTRQARMPGQKPQQMRGPQGEANPPGGRETPGRTPGRVRNRWRPQIRPSCGRLGPQPRFSPSSPHDLEAARKEILPAFAERRGECEVTPNEASRPPPTTASSLRPRAVGAPTAWWSPLQTRAWGGFVRFNKRDVSLSSASGPHRYGDALDSSPRLQSCALPCPNTMKTSSCEKEYFWSVALGHGVHPSLQRF